MSYKPLEELSIDELFAKLSLRSGSSLSKLASKFKENEVDGAVLADSAEDLNELFKDLEMAPKVGPLRALKKFIVDASQPEQQGTECTTTQEDANSLSLNTVDIPITKPVKDTPTPTEPSIPVILEGPRILKRLTKPVPLKTSSSRRGITVKAVATNHRDPSEMKVMLIVDPNVVPIEELDISAFGTTTVTISGGPLKKPVLHTFELNPPETYLPRKSYQFSDATNNRPILEKGLISFVNKATQNRVQVRTGSLFNMEGVASQIPNGIYNVFCDFPGFSDYTFPNIHFNNMWSSEQKATLFLTSKARFATGADLITLRWNANPRDLDLHVVSSKGDHVFYNNQVSRNYELDIDVTNGMGPETLTIKQNNGEQKYFVFVHLYHGVGKLYASGARLKCELPSVNQKFDMAIPRSPVAGNPRIWAAFAVIGNELKKINQVWTVNEVDPEFKQWIHSECF